MQRIGERIACAAGAALLGIFIGFFFCLETGTFSGSTAVFVFVPAILAILGFLMGDKVIKVMGHIIRWL